jgi:hypothetical protein
VIYMTSHTCALHIVTLFPSSFTGDQEPCQAPSPLSLLHLSPVTLFPYSQVMRDPVKLPDSGVIVDRSTIERHLLSQVGGRVGGRGTCVMHLPYLHAHHREYSTRT